VDQLVMKALARHSSRRFASAAEMAKAISEILGEPTRTRSRRRAMGASILAAAMGFAVVLLFGQVRPYLPRLPEYMPWLNERVIEPAPAIERSEPSRLPPKSLESPRRVMAEGR
jgi:hypothetical protein